MSETDVTEFDRRGFIQAPTIAGLTSVTPATAIGAGASAITPNVTMQPNPSFPEDLRRYLDRNTD
jgi:hypothetical protein